MFDEILKELDFQDEMDQFLIEENVSLELDEAMEAELEEFNREQNWLDDWYADSPSGSVLADYENGNVEYIYAN